MIELIERAAIAANEAMGYDPECTEGQLAARAVIMAIREPSEAMLKAAWDKGMFDAPPAPEEAWQAMIDEALNNPQN